MTKLPRDGLALVALAIIVIGSASVLIYTGALIPGEPGPLAPEDTPEPTATTTAQATTEIVPATTAAPTTTVVPTTTAEPFDPIVTFETCQRVRIGGTGVTYLAVLTEKGVVAEKRDANISGSEIFETEDPIEEVYVTSDTKEAMVENPKLDTCTDPESTPEDEPTPVPVTEEPITTTATPTPTPTPEPTTTTTTTTEPTPTPEPLRKSKLSVHVESESVGTEASAVYEITNYHEDAVSLDFDVLYYHERLGSDKLLKADRHPLTLEAGETVTVRSEYIGEESADTIDYAKRSLRRA